VKPIFTNFLKTHHTLVSSRAMISHIVGFASRVTNASQVLDATQSAQGFNSNAHTQNSPTNSKIFHLRLGSHKEISGRAQEVVERLFKRPETSKPRERGLSDFYRNLKN
jgi:hypothetical protein